MRLRSMAPGSPAAMELFLFRALYWTWTVKFFFTRRQPEATRILLVESGSRYLLEGLISGIRSTYGEDIFVDLVTCYPGLPEGFRQETTRVYRVTGHRGRAGRRRLYAELKRNHYS